MKKVEIHISRNADHRFIINGETVYEGDTIANYVHKPFDTWKNVILQELYENCNEEYCIYLSAGEEEYRFLETARKSFPKCVDIIWNGKSCSDSAQRKNNSDINIWEELNNLYSKKGNTIATTKKIKIGLCISADCMSEYSLLMDSIVNVGFSTGSLSYKCPYFNFVIQEIEEYDIPDFEGACFVVGTWDETTDNVIQIEDCSEAGEIIKKIIGQRYVEKFIAEHGVDSKDDEVKESKSSGQVNLTVDIPDRIDVGKSQLIGIVGMPKLKALELLRFEMSEQGILKYDRGRLFAVAPGSVEVRVKLKGKIEPVKRCMVEAVAHTYVQSIELNKDYFKGTVGDSFKIKPNFYPLNAENTNDVKYESMNSRIAGVGSDGLVELFSTGKTKIKVSVGDVEAYLTVESELKITKIVVSNESVKIGTGESQSLYVYVEPACYNSDSLQIIVENPDIAVYERGVIKALTPGCTMITFKSPNSNCEAKAEINVISSTYILARRALETKNYSDASKFYEQIRMENPNDWEANFFSVYAKTYRAATPDIQRMMETLQNTVGTTYDLILGIYSHDERIDAVTRVLYAVSQISSELAVQASNDHSRTKTGDEHLQSRATCSVARHFCAALDYFAANTAEAWFIGSYPQLRDVIINTWKVGISIDVQTLQYCSGQDKNIVQSDITTVTQAVRRYEPEYNAPRPTGGDTAIFDYLSFFF